MGGNKSPVNVAIVTFVEATAGTVFGMYDLFHSAGRDWPFVTTGTAGASCMRVSLVAAHAGPMRVGNGVQITPDYDLAHCPPPDVICVPDLFISPDASVRGHFSAEIAWLRACYANGATIATACSGALLLAEAGLLQGSQATTHWAYREGMARQYPGVQVDSKRALVVSGEGQRLIMAGGGTSWLDLALFVIARTCGIDEAMQVAKVHLIDWHRVGQQPFASLTCTRQAEDAVIAQCQGWIAQHYGEHAPVAAMAARSGLPERSFSRRFKQATGMAPMAYVHALRLEEAKQMLEAGQDPVERIAAEVGYEDPGYFARLFRQHVGLTPAQYRKRFGSMRQAMSQLTETAPA